MAEMVSSISLIVATGTILLFSTISASAQTPGAFKRIYAFGDSFTDTGNLRIGEEPNGFKHFSTFPYGTTYFHKPTNRYSDGRLVIDLVAQSMNLPFMPPYLGLRSNNGTATDTHGVNFAAAGATAINHAFYRKNDLTLDKSHLSIESEVVWFEKHFETLENNEKVSLFQDSLFWIGEIGVNDYAYTFGSTYSIDVVRQYSIAAITRSLEKLLRKGVKYFLVQGHPPTGCLPLAMSLAGKDNRDDIGCVKTVNNRSFIHNHALESKLEQLRVKYPSAKIVYADYWSAYRAVIQNPTKYGITEKFKACCGTGQPYNFMLFETCGTPTATVCKHPSQYINWDGVHLTEAMYKVITNMFLDGSFTRPKFSYLLARS